MRAYHPNNMGDCVDVKGYIIPRYMEFTFLRKDRINAEERTYRSNFPHALDSDNTLKASYKLPACWYRSP